jgi:hypothetical protein
LKLCEQSRKLGTIIKKQIFDGLFMLHSSLHFLQPCSQQSESRDRLSTRGLSFKRQFKSFLYLTNCFSRNLLKLESVKRNGSCLLLQTALKWFNINQCLHVLQFQTKIFLVVFSTRNFPECLCFSSLRFKILNPDQFENKNDFTKTDKKK